MIFNSLNIKHEARNKSEINSFAVDGLYTPFTLHISQEYVMSKGKGKSDPLQAWTGPEGSRKLRFPDFMKKAQDCGKVVSLTHRLPLPLGNNPGTHFC